MFRSIKAELLIGLGLVVGLVMVGGSIVAKFPNPEISQPTSTLESVSLDEVAKHNSAQDCWIVIEGRVLDVTAFVNIHPGGADKIIDYCGSDATQAFNQAGHSNKAIAIASKFFEMKKTYLMSRTIHRTLVLPISGLIMLFGLTGFWMKFPNWIPAGVEPNLVRYIHNQMSTLFGIGLTVMAISGGVMYFYPLIKKRLLKTHSSD